MAKKITLDNKVDALTNMIAKGFAAIAGDITDIKEHMATKDQVIALHTQVNAIERQLRETKIEIRLANLEEIVFRKVRA